MWNMRGNRSTLTRDLNKKSCNCKNSRCLKLYCECFASGRYCDNCNCVNCCNNRENEGTRKAAVESILDRNPNAFRPKIQGGITEDGLAAAANARHNKGCNCKKSGCLKKYCECFQAGIFCSDNCKCLECKNYEGSAAREHMLGSGGGEARSMQHRSTSPPRGMRGGPPSNVRRPQSGFSGGRYGSLEPPGPSSQGVLASRVTPAPPMGRLLPPRTGSLGPGGQAGPLPALRGKALVKNAVEELHRNGGVNQVTDLLCMVAKECKDKCLDEAKPAAPATRESDMEEAEPSGEQPSQPEANGAADENHQPASPGAAAASSERTLYEQQEHAVLQEFNDILQRLLGKMNVRMQQQQQQQQQQMLLLRGALPSGLRPPASVASPMASQQSQGTGVHGLTQPGGQPLGQRSLPSPLPAPQRPPLQAPPHVAGIMAHNIRPSANTARQPSMQANGAPTRPQQPMVVGAGTSLPGHVLPPFVSGQLTLQNQGGMPVQMVHVQQMNRQGMPQGITFVVRKDGAGGQPGAQLLAQPQGPSGQQALPPGPGGTPPAHGSQYIGSVQQMQAHAAMANLLQAQQQGMAGQPGTSMALQQHIAQQMQHLPGPPHGVHQMVSQAMHQMAAQGLLQQQQQQIQAQQQQQQQQQASPHMPSANPVISAATTMQGQPAASPATLLQVAQRSLPAQFGVTNAGNGMPGQMPGAAASVQLQVPGLRATLPTEAAKQGPVPMEQG